MAMHRSAPGRFVRFFAAILALTTVFALTGDHPTAAQQPDISPRQQAECLAGDARSARDLRTGAMRFIGTEAGRAIPHPRPFDAAQSPEAAARAYLSVCGSLFGVQEQAAQLAVTGNTTAEGRRSVVRFQQRHQGIPIIGGELIVHLDNARNVLAVAGRALPTIAVDTTPAIDAGTAVQTALEVVAKTYGLSARALAATAPVLSIYDPMMLGPQFGTHGARLADGRHAAGAPADPRIGPDRRPARIGHPAFQPGRDGAESRDLHGRQRHDLARHPGLQRIESLVQRRRSARHGGTPERSRHLQLLSEQPRAEQHRQRGHDDQVDRALRIRVSQRVLER